MNRRSPRLEARTGAKFLCLGLLLLALAACKKPTFQENYSKGLEKVKQGNYASAEPLLERACLQNPADLEAKYQLALVKLKLNDVRAAYSLLREAEEKDYSQSPVTAKIRIELARLFIASKQYDQVQNRMLWVLDKNPYNQEARALLAAAMALQVQSDAAREQVHLLLADNPASLEGRVLDAALNLTSHQAQQAEASLQDEVALTKRSSDSLVALANFYQLTRQLDKAVPLLTEAVQRDPQNVGIRLELGWVYSQAGNRTAAEKTFRELPQILPANRAAEMGLINYYVNIGDWSKAVKELEALVQKTDSKKPDPQLLDTLAAVYYRAGRSAEAQKLADQLIAQNNQDATAQLLRGLLHLDAHEYEVAVLNFNNVIGNHPDSAPAEYLLARASFGAGKEQTAVQHMERALQLDSELLPARLWLIDFHLKHASADVGLDLARATPEIQRAMPEIVIMSALCSPSTDLSPDGQVALQRALLARPKFIVNYENQSMALLLRKYGGPVREQLEAALRAHPDSRQAQTLLMNVLEGQGKLDELMAQVQKQVAANPKSVADILVLARLQIKRGEFNAAHATLSKAAEMEPNNAEVLVRLAEAETDSGNFDDAERHLDFLTEHYPKSSEAWLFKGIVYEQRGVVKDARLLYEEALKLDGNNAVAANNLALLLATSFKDPTRGLELARKAHVLDPANPEFSDTLGWIHYLLGNYAEAMAALDQAVHVRPEDANFLYHLGMAQSRAGRDNDALTSLSAALRLNPHLPQLVEVNAELDTVRSHKAH
jgi:tetratricopeptide (TPR) repeat protein